MVVHDQYTFDGVSHTIVLIIVLQALQTGSNRGIFFGLCFLGTANEED